jgi:hypothetical protein
MTFSTSWPLGGYLAVSLAILLWDVILAGQIVRARRTSRLFLAITSLCGLLVVPGAVIAVAATTVFTGRVIHLIAWLWPAILLCFVLQAGYVLSRALVGRWLSLPILALNTTLFVAASVRVATGWVTDLPSPLVGAPLAQASAMGLLFGRDALASPWLLLLPLLAPSHPARWRIGVSLRVLLAGAAAAAVLLTVSRYPPSVHAAETFAPLAGARLQERPLGDFALGVRIFPTVTSPPAPLPIARDLALADTMGASVVAVVVAPAGIRAATLDSLAATLADVRRGGVRLVVTLGYGPQDGEALRRDAIDYRDRRLSMVDQVVRRLRPDLLVPALDPMDAGARVLGHVPLAWWEDYLSKAAALAHRLRPRTRVGLAASSFSPADSALYAWGERSREIDVLGFSLAPSWGGGASLEARLRLAERWLRASRKDQWVFSARAFPRVFGERNQERATWGMLAWATSQPRVRAIILDAAGDYETLDGLRDPGGRLRPVVGRVARAREALAETSERR